MTGWGMKKAQLGRYAVLAATVALALPAVAQAGNEVTNWNEIAMNTVNAQAPIASAPPAAAVFMAMVQGAVYGAANAVDRHGTPYLINRSFPKASEKAAVATAAYRVLNALFPSGALDSAYAASLAAADDGDKNQGIEVGTMAADAMLAQGHDGRAGQFGCSFVSPSPGVWQPLPSLTSPLVPACDPSTWVANATPFILNSPSQFRTAGPYPLNSPEYAADYNEVKSIGKIDSATRTAAQTHAAVFWNTSPPPNYNGLARRLVDQFSLDVSDSARLFALLDLSTADAIINAWNDKYYYRFWRPITAIRQGDTDGNADTLVDPNWTPLFDPSLPFSPTPVSPAPVGGIGPALVTPPYPDHVSGATTQASASMHAFASFFGTDEMPTPFYLTSSRFPGEHREFTRFSDVTNEIVEARIWAGIHFRNADVQAANLGAQVEQYVHKTQFAFVH
jgi:hypothetical protein